MILAAVALCCAAATRTADSAAARAWIASGIAREAVLDYRGALTMYGRAVAADSDSFEAHWRYQGLLVLVNGEAARERAYASWARSADPERRCIARLARIRAGEGENASRDIRALETATGRRTVCSAAFLVAAPDQSRPIADRIREADARFAIASKAAPTLSWLWHQHASALLDAGDTSRAIAVLEDGFARMTEPARFTIAARLLELLPLAHDSAHMRAIAQSIETATRDSRIGIREFALGALAQAEANQARSDALLLRELATTRLAPYPEARYSAAIALGARFLARGDVRAAIQYYDTAVVIADSARRADWMATAYARRGRAYVKAARLPDAERDLATARRFADDYDPYLLADIEHNLAHAYESAGDWPHALATVQAFVEASQPVSGDGMDVIALRDAGIIASEANARARATDYFERMVRLVNERRAYWYWAGEYFERLGDGRHALEYYQHVTEPKDGDLARALAGIARVYESLGVADSALVAARRHDALTPTPEEIPMSPRLLMKLGRRAEAEAIARHWRDHWRASGNAYGDLVATLELARLLLETAPQRSLDEALHAEQASRVLHASSETGEAYLAAGLARARMNDLDALRDLAAAESMGIRAHDDDIAERAEVALGDVLRSRGQAQRALTVYREAAGRAERMSARFDEDPDRVRRRDQLVRPFDAVLSVLLSDERRADPAAVYEWSVRRRAVVGGSGIVHADLGAARRSLSADEALLDYVLVDSSAVAVVATRGAARLVPLGATGEWLRAKAAALRAPMATTYMRRLDLARATYDTSIAHALYAALMAPVLRTVHATRLRIMADGVLELVPFDALMSATGPRTRYVIDDYETMMILAGGRWRVRGGGGRGLLLVMGDVPGGDAERQAVMAASGESVTVLDGTNATPEALLERWRSADVLHIAAHAITNVLDPTAAYVELSDGRGGVAALRLSQIEANPLAARLVVLTGCETESGAVLHGSGVAGLARAFLVAGAQNVVATRWPVGEQAAEVMRLFYGALGRGVSVGAALREAKLEVRRKEPVGMWAGFVAVGRGA